MHVVILGASGLIGHKLYDVLRGRFERVTPVLHGAFEDVARFDLFDGSTAIVHADATRFDEFAGLLDAVAPDVVLNCVGLTKRRPELADRPRAILINSVFPHQLESWAAARGTRLIHFSTDCVFDGDDGPYTEASPTTAHDVYGQTKALGELTDGPGLTIRSSFIGRELHTHSELLDWFLLQHGTTIRGFTDSWYSGVSTPTMARIVGDIIADHPELCGLFQLGHGNPISKYDLLCLARNTFDVDVRIVPDDSVRSNRILDGKRLRDAVGLSLPDWPTMFAELAADPLYARAEVATQSGVNTAARAEK